MERKRNLMATVHQTRLGVQCEFLAERSTGRNPRELVLEHEAKRVGLCLGSLGALCGRKNWFLKMDKKETVGNRDENDKEELLGDLSESKAVILSDRTASQ